MKIEYFHGSAHGNGAAVAEEFSRVMGARGDVVAVHHVSDVDPKRPPTADLYVLSSPGRFGKPTRQVRRFLKNLRLPPGTECAILTTELNAHPEQPDKQVPKQTPEPAPDADPWQRVRPVMRELLEAQGVTLLAEGCVFVTGMKGPLEAGWQQKVERFAADVAAAHRSRPDQSATPS